MQLETMFQPKDLNWSVDPAMKLQVKDAPLIRWYSHSAEPPELVSRREMQHMSETIHDMEVDCYTSGRGVGLAVAVHKLVGR